MAVTTSNLSKLILKNHNSQAYGFRQDYLDYLKNESSVVADKDSERTGNLSLGPNHCPDHGVSLVNQIYGLLEPYVLALNQSMQDRRFTITPSAPFFSNEEIEERWPYKSASSQQVYSFRFASLELSINVKASKDVVAFYVLPANKFTQTNKPCLNSEALMRFSYREEDGSWWVEGKQLSPERLERYCLLFFDYFVKESKGMVQKRLAK